MSAPQPAAPAGGPADGAGLTASAPVTSSGAPPREPAAHVRRAVVSDADAVSDLAVLTFPMACPPGTSPEDVAQFCRDNLSPAHFAEYLRSPDHTVLLAERVDGGDGERVPATPLAYALLCWGEIDPEVAGTIANPTVLLSKCYTHPSSHGSGMSSALMEAVLAAARSRGVRTVWLGVNQANVRAQRFYAKHGFTVVGTKHMQVGSGRHDDFVMALRVG